MDPCVWVPPDKPTPIPRVGQKCYPPCHGSESCGPVSGKPQAPDRWERVRERMLGNLQVVVTVGDRAWEMA